MGVEGRGGDMVTSIFTFTRPIFQDVLERFLSFFCTKVFGTHIFYADGGGEGGELTPHHDLQNRKLYKLQLWQATLQ